VIGKEVQEQKMMSQDLVEFLGQVQLEIEQVELFSLVHGLPHHQIL